MIEPSAGWQRASPHGHCESSWTELFQRLEPVSQRQRGGHCLLKCVPVGWPMWRPSLRRRDVLESDAAAASQLLTQKSSPQRLTH